MILMIEAVMRGMGAPPPSAPALSLKQSVSWSEDPLRWQLSLPATPEEAAQMIRRHQLEINPEHPYLWNKVDGSSEIRLTVACEGAEWDQLQEYLSEDGRLRGASAPQDRLQLEWPFLHPALSNLKKGTVKLGEIYLHTSPTDNRMVMYLPADQELLDTLRENGYLLQPVNEWQEDVMWGEVVMGRILKPRLEGTETPEGPAPFLMLHGLSSALGNREMMRPFSAPLEITDAEELERIIRESASNIQDIAPDEEEMDDLERTFRQEYAGLAPDDLELLLRTVIGFTEGIATDTCEAYELNELPEEWMRQTFQVLVTAMITGSRVARAELARAGFETDLSHELGENLLSDLINGQLTFADAMRRAIRDDRSWRCWSLPWGAAQIAEGLLPELLSEELPDDPPPDAILGDLITCFDLGVRYQMARVAPRLLEVQEPDWSLDEEQ